VWRRSGSVVGFGAVVVTVLALVMQAGVAAAGSSGSDGRTTVRALTTTRGTSVGPTFFGMHAPLLGQSFPNAPVGSVDLMTGGVYWPDLETSPGVFTFTKLDSEMAMAREHRTPPLLVLGQTPSFHIAAGAEPHGVASVPDMDAWKAYVTAVVQHLTTEFPGPVDYQLLTEPNVRNNFTGSPQQAADLVAAGAEIIHLNAPGATVVAPAMVLRLASERDFMHDFFASKVAGAPIGDSIDVVGVDPYPLQDGQPENTLRLITRAQRMLASEGVNAPMWNLEINYFVPVGGVTPAAPPTDRVSSSYVIRTFVLSAAANIKRVYWLGWLRYFNLGISMVAPDGVTPTAAGRAFARVHGWLIGQRARGCTYDKANGVYACRFVKDGRSRWVYWVQSGSAAVRAPSGVRRVQSMSGVTSRTRPGTRLRITNAPILVY
jgi:hypothetical protein